MIKTVKKKEKQSKIIVLHPEKNRYIITKAVEKKKTYIGRNSKRYPKSRCGRWAPEGEALINELEVEHDEFIHNKEIILEKFRGDQNGKESLPTLRMYR